MYAQVSYVSLALLRGEGIRERVQGAHCLLDVEPRDGGGRGGRAWNPANASREKKCALRFPTWCWSPFQGTSERVGQSLLHVESRDGGAGAGGHIIALCEVCLIKEFPKEVQGRKHRHTMPRGCPFNPFVRLHPMFVWGHTTWKTHPTTVRDAADSKNVLSS